MSPRIVGLACVVPVLLCSLLLSQDKEPRRVALLIGINKYSDESDLKALDYAEADVVEMEKLLKDKYQVVLLTGKDATVERCTKEIDKIKAMKLGATDTLLVGLAGHGKLMTVKERDVSFFIPYNGVPKLGRIDSLLSIDALVADLEESGAGKRFILIDACRSRGGRQVRGGKDVTFAIRSGTGILFSCSEGEKAEEPEEFKHGLFFYHVIQRLRESNGKLTWGHLVADVANRVPEAMPKKLADEGAMQHPDDKSDGVARAVIFEGKVGAVARKAGEVVEVSLGKGVKMKFCWIPPGEAQLGSPKAERQAVLKQLDKTEEPDWLQSEAEDVRGKYTSKGFWLGKYPVTQEEWQTLIGANPSYFVPAEETIKKAEITDTSRFPVEQVSWDDCQKFLKKLNDVDLPAALGKGKFVLPHEDEWEYACRGGKGNKRPYYFGDELNGKQANCDGNYPYGTTDKGPYLARTVAVDGREQEDYEKKTPHPWGLCHMHGNVWQWCENLYSKDARVVRGGSWSGSSRGCRAAFRYWVAPSVRSYFGVRVAFRLD